MSKLARIRTKKRPSKKRLRELQKRPQRVVSVSISILKTIAVP